MIIFPIRSFHINTVILRNFNFANWKKQSQKDSDLSKFTHFFSLYKSQVKKIKSHWPINIFKVSKSRNVNVGGHFYSSHLQSWTLSLFEIKHRSSDKMMLYLCPVMSLEQLPLKLEMYYLMRWNNWQCFSLFIYRRALIKSQSSYRYKKVPILKKTINSDL